MTEPQDFKFSDKDFAYLQEIAQHYAGIHLTKYKKMLVYNRLIRRLRELKINSFYDYCELLKNNPSELHHFINAITTTITSFFRSEHQFHFLQDVFLKQCLETKKNHRLRIWSAGCSSGEEPYSIAMVVFETLSSSEQWDVTLLATDINENALLEARKGVYPDEEISALSIERKKRWFLKGIAGMKGYVQIKPELRQRITFAQLNLMSDWPPMGLFDIIFCRNVVIYFNKESQKILFDRFADLLEVNGVLMLGHAENIYKISDRFKHLGNNVYRKIR